MAGGASARAFAIGGGEAGRSSIDDRAADLT